MPSTPSFELCVYFRPCGLHLTIRFVIFSGFGRLADLNASHLMLMSLRTPRYALGSVRGHSLPSVRNPGWISRTTTYGDSPRGLFSRSKRIPLKASTRPTLSPSNLCSNTLLSPVPGYAGSCFSKKKAQSLPSWTIFRATSCVTSGRLCPSLPNCAWLLSSAGTCVNYAQIPGPIASDDQIRRPRAQMIGGQLGRSRAPFGSYAEMSAWWNERYAMSMECAPQRHEGAPPEPFDDSAPLVLTHCDLNMRNILVGDDGRLYLIDWELSGFYPPWFEYVNWRFWVWIGLGGEGGKLDRTDRLWNILIPFITLGPYNRQERWYSRVLPALAYFDVRRLGYS